MADNYIDVPVIICKIRSAGTCTTGGILKGSDTTGWADATSDTTAMGVIALEPASDSAQWLSAMFMGTAWMAMADSIKAGRALMWTATDTLDECDCARKTIGMLVDGCDTVTADRTHRVFFGGRGNGPASYK
jgi:hypothetical protein